MAFPEPVHDIVQSLLDSYRMVGGINHLDETRLPSMESVDNLLSDLKSLVFPGFYKTLQVVDEATLPYATAEHVFRAAKGLIREVQRALWYSRCQEGKKSPEVEVKEQAQTVVFQLLKAIPGVRLQIQEDVQAMLDGDPAAKSSAEIVLAYPGIEAVLVYRLAHILYQSQVPLIPRMMSELIHRKTGIDIHPGAQIGRRFYIDHGTGIVIGETCIIGDNVKLYQGVTLGALSVKKNEQAKKRHPTLEDSVTIYAGATILGGDTIIGNHSTIGGNCWVTSSVPPYSILQNRPQDPIILQRDLVITDYQI
ncbi:MAG: serine acetyltransferase [Spirochaetales bacterium]|nr:serine acetyltransferase [Spirochaetales bacterium]